jgi:hypothetical protein
MSIVVKKPPKIKSNRPMIATDSEWDTSLPDPWISTAFAYGSQVVVFMRDDLGKDTKDRLKSALGENDRLLFIRRDDDTDLLSWAKKLFGIRDKRVSLAIYFTPKDVEYAVGWSRFKEAMDKRQIRQRNNLSGRVGSVFIKDIIGWAGKSSLEKFAAALGVAMADKGGMKEYKANMIRGLTERPEDFLRYAVDDARALLRVHSAFLDKFNRVLRETLAMEEKQWEADDIPMTVGALVAKTIERWLFTQAGELSEVMKFCVRKVGILNPDHKQYKASLLYYWRAVERFTELDTLLSGLREGDVDLEMLDKGVFSYTALNSGGICWWADKPATDSACFNALVQGGRCCNERPDEYRIGAGLDVDISGCYGESLRTMTFPVGVPTVWSYSPNQKRPTLGDWLDDHEKNLVDGLWTATVSGWLSFAQDLVYSKLAKAGDIKRMVLTPEKEDSDLVADFVLLRREIKNGIVTSDVLRVLRAVATNQEWRELRKLEIVSAVAYLASDRQPDCGSWCETVLAHKGEYRRGTRSGSPVDTRCRAWYGVPLEGFVGRLVDERREQKKFVKDSGLSEVERSQAKGMDNLLKLMVNTVYGVMASRYFPIGNTVVGNNITARARVGVWMLAKSLGLRQSITDGGIYTPGSVPMFGAKKPGLSVFAHPWQWRDDRRRRYTSMGGLDWTQPAEWAERAVDTLAMDHVRDFWIPYGLTFLFRVEHKLDHTFSGAAYWNKGDYALATLTGREYALRGKDRAKRDAKKRHPTFLLLDNILDGSDIFPTDLNYTKGGILKVGKWLIAQQSNGYEQLKNLRPGANQPESEYTARYNNTHFPADDVRQHDRRRNRKKVHRGKSVAWFERFAKRGIAGLHRAMARASLEHG